MGEIMGQTEEKTTEEIRIAATQFGDGNPRGACAGGGPGGNAPTSVTVDRRQQGGEQRQFVAMEHHAGKSYFTEEIKSKQPLCTESIALKT